MNPYVNLLTGPVAVSAAVRSIYSNIPDAHRSERFVSRFRELQSALCALVSARQVCIMTGSGTLANTAIGYQLLQMNAPGIILSNGEFGQRLMAQADKLSLPYEPLSSPWANAFNLESIEEKLKQNPDIKWLWMVHSETSTGILNPIAPVAALCKKYKVALCLDCISSVGTCAIDLSEVYLASGVSGKALCAYAGLAFVWYNHTLSSSTSIPDYMDLAYYAAAGGIPFTIPANAAYALHHALEELMEEQTSHYEKIRSHSEALRDFFKNYEFKLINEDRDTASAAVLTIALPDTISSVALGDSLAAESCHIGYKSEYLIKRNWIQTYVTRNVMPETISVFKKQFEAILSRVGKEEHI